MTLKVWFEKDLLINISSIGQKVLKDGGGQGGFVRVRVQYVWDES